MPAEYLYNSMASFLNQAAGMGAADITLQLTDTALFPTTCPFRVVVGSEIMLVTANVAGLLTVTRGYEGTVAAVHTYNSPVVITATAGAFYAVFQAL